MVAAAGVPGILQPEHISPGAIVVGGGVRYEGRKLLPDVDEACEAVAGAITPRVGGVGPTTIAMLFRNAIEAAERNVQRRAQSREPCERDLSVVRRGGCRERPRCPECNMTLAGIGARPAAFTRQSVWYWAGALLAIYLVVLAIVVAAR